MAKDVDALELRPVTADEFPAYSRAVELAFGEEPSADVIEHWREFVELDRTLAAFDGDRIVGCTLVHTYGMSLPGGGEAPCAGVSAVAVAHDWRRRGLLTRMMRRQLDDVRAAGEPFAALYASESPIYGRFGYGIAAPVLDLEIERPWAALQDPVPEPEVVLVSAEQLIAAGPPIREAARATRGGMMSRSDGWWRAWLARDEEGERDGYSPRFHALIPDRGYAVYRVKPDWRDTLPQGKLLVIELVAADPEAYAALWQHVFGVDLVHTIAAPMRPPDDPILSMVVNHQRLKTRGGEDFYLRLVDVADALPRRRYDAEGHLVIGVRDAFCPWNQGQYELEAADGAATCTTTDRDPDLELDTRDLAAVTLGGVTPWHLAAAGRIQEHRAGSVSLLQRMVAVDLAPWHTTEF